VGYNKPNRTTTDDDVKSQKEEEGGGEFDLILKSLEYDICNNLPNNTCII